MQHATVLDVLDFRRGIDAALKSDGGLGAIAIGDIAVDLLQWFDRFQTANIDRFIAREFERFACVTTCELERNNAHTHEVGTVNSLKTLNQHSAITALTPKSAVPLAAQSREEPAPYCSPPKTTSGVPAS